MISIQQTIRRAAGPSAKQLIKGTVVAAVLALAAFLLYRTLSQYSFEEISRSIARIPVGRLAAALGFAGASYVLLTGFDWLALRYVGRPLAWPRAALASFASLSIGHNVGFAALSSGALRYRFYSRWGLGAAEVAQVIVFCGLTVGVGLATLGGVALLLRPGVAAQMTGLAPLSAVATGVALLAGVGAYLTLAGTLRRRLTVFGYQLSMPPLRLALAQAAIGTANFACVAACLHQVLTALQDLPYLAVAVAYVTANAAGLISHVPGGLGVIETVVALLLCHADLIGALIAFRVVYYLIPLCLGGTAFVLAELLIRQHRVSGREAAAGRAAK